MSRYEIAPEVTVRSASYVATVKLHRQQQPLDEERTVMEHERCAGGTDPLERGSTGLVADLTGAVFGQ